MGLGIKTFLRRKLLPSPLTRDGRLKSDLWLDRTDAAEAIVRRRRSGELDEPTANRLSQLSEEGFTVFDLGSDESEDQGLLDRSIVDIESTVDRLWRDRPEEVAYAYDGPYRRFRLAEPEHRSPGYRIADLHAVSEGARDLFLHPEIFRLIELAFGQPAVATQSLFFEHGSQQGLHRDPVHVYHRPPSHLLAAWIALEDIEPGSGPLVYWPGSHRLPYYQFAPGEYRHQHGHHTDEDDAAMTRFEIESCRRAGLEEKVFLPRRGQVLIWHASLLHGGRALEDPDSTRKSLVVHFATRRRNQICRRSVVDEAGAEPVVYRTEETVEQDGRIGFASPIR